MKHVISQRIRHVRCVIEAVYHRHNISAILRTCDALGIHTVHLITDSFRATKGAARGAERWLDVVRHQTPEEAISVLRADGYKIYIADLGNDSVTPEQVPIDAPVCLWFGAELVGVSDAAQAAADGVMTIPMRGFAQSLNVSVAAAIALRPVVERARALGDEALLTPEVRGATWDAWMSRAENVERHSEP
jgi:tRNA (guanosine-2'-O-)-methyltransferase